MRINPNIIPYFPEELPNNLNSPQAAPLFILPADSSWIIAQDLGLNGYAGCSRQGRGQWVRCSCRPEAPAVKKMELHLKGASKSCGCARYRGIEPELANPLTPPARIVGESVEDADCDLVHLADKYATTTVEDLSLRFTDSVEPDNWVQPSDVEKPLKDLDLGVGRGTRSLIGRCEATGEALYENKKPVQGGSAPDTLKIAYPVSEEVYEGEGRRNTPKGTDPNEFLDADVSNQYTKGLSSKLNCGEPIYLCMGSMLCLEHGLQFIVKKYRKQITLMCGCVRTKAIKSDVAYPPAIDKVEALNIEKKIMSLARERDNYPNADCDDREREDANVDDVDIDTYSNDEGEKKW